MRTARCLYPRVAALDNLLAAFRDARRGKRRKREVAAFECVAESEVCALHRELDSDTWMPGGYRTHVIREPKKRLIAAAPFRDRVVHHAVHRVLAPVLMRRFVADSFACRTGFGTHRAVLQFRALLRRHRFVARLDVRRCFLEIDHRVLQAIIGHTVRDARLMALLDRVLASGRSLYADPAVLDALGVRGVYQPSPHKGLPIGNLTSQLFANVYLDGLDHFVKRDLRVPGYARYLDDLVLFGDDRRVLRDQAWACVRWLAQERRLEMHTEGARPVSTAGEHRFLGQVVSRGGSRPRARTLKRLTARLRHRATLAITAEQREAWAIEARANLRALWL